MPIVALNVVGTPRAEQNLIQQANGSVTLNAVFARIVNGSALKVSNRGIVTGWTSTAPEIDWTVGLYESGMYNVIIRTTPLKSAGGWDSAQWDGAMQFGNGSHGNPG